MAVVALVGCHTISEEAAPTAPSEVSTFSAISIPVIGLSQGTPSPTPAPAPTTPEPTPEPTPAPPAASSCNLPSSNPTNPVCTDESPYLLEEIEAALDAVTEQHPELFNFNDTRCPNCYYVKEPRLYIEEMGKQLARQGVCMKGGLEEIGVKSSNDFNEQYDILLSTDHIRRGTGAYRGICRPSLF